MKGSTPRQATEPAQSYLVMAGVVVLAGIFSALIECKVPSILEPLSAQFGMDAATGSLMMSSFTIMGLFFSIPASKVIQHLGAKRILVDSVVLMLAGSLLGTFAPNAVVLIISRSIEGVALVSTTIAGAAYIRDSAPPANMGTAISIWSIWFALGSFAAGVLSPVLYESLGFEALWLAYAALALVAALAIRFCVKAPNIVFASKFEESGKPRYRELLKRDVILIMVVFATYNVLSLAVVSYVPTILQNQGFEPTASGFISTLPMLLSIASVPLMGIVSDKLGRVKLLLSGALLACAVAAPLMYITTGWQLWTAAIVYGALGCSGAGLMMVGLLKALPRVELVPLALGIFSTAMALGQFLGSFLLPFLLGPDLSNWYLAAAALLVIGLVGFAASALCTYR